MLRRSSKTKTENTALSRRVTREQVHEAFGPNVSSAINVSRGETIVVETQDCYRGLLTNEPDSHKNIDRTGSIPVTGPIYVEDAHIGDVLSIQVKEIKTAGTGVFAARPETGVPGQEVQQPQVRVMEVKDNSVQLDERLKLPVHPVIGIMGVAAKHGEIETIYPGRHGGNMDTLEITTGSKVFLPVQVNGALLSLGDVKACVGDGQIAGSGVEVAAEVTVRVDTLPGGRFSWPRVESKGEWITITSASTVDQAARLAITEMVKWISQDKGLDFDTAYTLVSLGGGLRVSQWGNPLITARMVFPKRLINKLKSVPTASGRLNYRALPPAANGDSSADAVAAETEQPASGSSRRSSSSRSQRSPGRSRQSGSRRGTRQRSNGAASPERAEGNLEEAAEQQVAANENDAKENSDVKESRVTADGNGHEEKKGENGNGSDPVSQKEAATVQTDAPAVQLETAPASSDELKVEASPAPASSDEPKAETKPAPVRRSRKTTRKPARATRKAKPEAEAAPAAPAAPAAGVAAEAVTAQPERPAGVKDSGNGENDDLKTEKGAETEAAAPEAAAPKRTFGRRRTVRRA